jgi:hypothetical protein
VADGIDGALFQFLGRLKSRRTRAARITTSFEVRSLLEAIRLAAGGVSDSAHTDAIQVVADAAVAKLDDAYKILSKYRGVPNIEEIMPEGAGA